MTVERYLFQSPYSNQVQIGRPDPSVKKEDEAGGTTSQLPENTNQTLQKAGEFQSTQESEVKPKVSSSQLLDVYA